jgi:nitroimidazol reductase NimA-like FMN-containing flavoprotein (pyridoxamine 5'-phosphate oxidase superfamily)
MEYRPMRRKDRIMDEENIRRVLTENSHGVLATVSEDGSPYANPISYVYYNECIYFHSAIAGHKVDNIARNNTVAFTVIGKVDMKVPKAQAYFESVIVFGEAVRVTDFDEQVAAMTEMMKIFMPDQAANTASDLTKSQKALIVYRIDIKHATGKLRTSSGGGH